MHPKDSGAAALILGKRVGRLSDNYERGELLTAPRQQRLDPAVARCHHRAYEYAEFVAIAVCGQQLSAQGQ